MQYMVFVGEIGERGRRAVGVAWGNGAYEFSISTDYNTDVACGGGGNCGDGRGECGEAKFIFLSKAVEPPFFLFFSFFVDFYWLLGFL